MKEKLFFVGWSGPTEITVIFVGWSGLMEDMHILHRPRDDQQKNQSPLALG
jgi:hypothetical protein